MPSLVDAVVIVKPKTVLDGHRKMWSWSWWRRSGRPTGRPPIDADLRALIRQMWRENDTWGEDRIAGELAKLGHQVSPRTVAKYRPSNVERGKGQKWSTFIHNHLHQAWACDWFTIVTWCFRVVYGWVNIDLGRRRIVDMGVTTVPSGQYAAQRFVQAVAENGNRAPRLLIRDRDQVYGEEFRRRVRNCGTRAVMGPPRSPTANAYCERMIGTLRRDCLDPILVRDEVHAERVLKEYVGYYHGRPHRGLYMQPPVGGRWLPPGSPTPANRVRSVAVLGGLHHEYGILPPAA
jgi:putative transposase